VEGGDLVVFHAASNFEGLAANFAVLYINLPGNRKVHDHRNLFAAVWTIEKMFHVECASLVLALQFIQKLAIIVISNPFSGEESLFPFELKPTAIPQPQGRARNDNVLIFAKSLTIWTQFPRRS
jgi:hypothetical protein